MHHALCIFDKLNFERDVEKTTIFFLFIRQVPFQIKIHALFVLQIQKKKKKTQTEKGNAFIISEVSKIRLVEVY